MSAQRLELTRGAVQLVRDWMELPGNERKQFAQAIAERAAVWSDESESIDF
jgi:hypothetical protein